MRPHPVRSPRIPGFLALALALLVPPLPASAKEEPTAAEQVLAVLVKAAKDEDSPAWIEALEMTPGVYEPAEPKIQKALMRQLGKAVQAKAHVVRTAALDAMVEIGDGDAAWKAGLRSIFPGVKRESTEPIDDDLFKALYHLRADAAIDTLLTYMKKGRNLGLTAASLRVLGAYERSKKRVEVLEGIAKVLVANAPGRGGAASPRWVSLVLHIVPSLNALTGRKYNAVQWGVMWKEHKGHPEVLFVDPLSEDEPG